MTDLGEGVQLSVCTLYTVHYTLFVCECGWYHMGFIFMPDFSILKTNKQQISKCSFGSSTWSARLMKASLTIFVSLNLIFNVELVNTFTLWHIEPQLNLLTTVTSLSHFCSCLCLCVGTYIICPASLLPPPSHPVRRLLGMEERRGAGPRRHGAVKIAIF